jgi:hypothetical protein
LFASLALGALVACSGSSDDSAAAPATSDAGVAPPAFTQVLSIDQIAVYQAVKVSLVSEGTTVTPNAPVIPKRPALVRVGTKTPAGTKLNKLAAELRIQAPGQPDLVLQRGPRVVRRFDEADLESSFTWELTADQVVQGAHVSVEIRDPSGADPGAVRYPAEGQLPLAVAELAPTLKVTFVPIRYEADGSNRVPSMDKQTIDAYSAALYRMYPVAAVEISVRDVVPWPLEVRGDGEGWSPLLDAIIETRQDDRVADDVYYVGVFAPAATEWEYCQGPCVLGIAPTARLIGGVDLRTAMIVGYHSPRQHGTLAQELAHAMGRLHAPCGDVAQIDRQYPYELASIGVWGWDVLDKKLVSPDERVDFMSYCDPIWVSDYTYANLYNEMVTVQREKRPDVGAPERRPMKTYHVGKDGSISRGPTVRGVPFTPADELVLESGSHEVVGKVRGSFRPLSNVGGGILVTPKEIPAATLERARFARMAIP